MQKIFFIFTIIFINSYSLDFEPKVASLIYADKEEFESLQKKLDHLFRIEADLQTEDDSKEKSEQLEHIDNEIKNLIIKIERIKSQTHNNSLRKEIKNYLKQITE